jgi:PhzF family phenazine biosynthesis protein
MNVERLAAFADPDTMTGGNPAGVVIEDRLPDAAAMQRIAAEVGYSETAFAAPDGDAWRVRYFAPAIEVPFCGHATIALGAALAARFGEGRFRLRLNDRQITVEGHRNGPSFTAALQSPPTRSGPASADLIAAALDLFSDQPADLDDPIPPAIAEAGARHLVLALRTRERLAAMRYPFETGKELMAAHGLTTISLLHAETPRLFHARNAFAIGGVVEDPATGAAAAALGGYLRDLGWPHGGSIEIIQGEDMGMRSRLTVEISPESGSSIRVSGAVRPLD